MKNFLFLLVLILTMSCVRTETKVVEYTELDELLENTIKTKSETGELDFFILPQSEDFASIPQDPRNPLTEAKVELGRLLFYETGMATLAKYPESMGTYSCSSCHQPKGSFEACLTQGIADGGMGNGYNGEDRVLNSTYPLDSIDVQAIRTPSMINACYNRVGLWNGKLGAKGQNIGTEHLWPEDSPNHLGYHGIETQAFIAQEVHRLKLEGELLETYKPMFDEAFPDVDVENRYDQERVALAMAAYERTVLSNNAPFQKWLRGNYLAMTITQKKGALLFFGKAGCVQCHTGPALSSEEFHAVGMNDINEVTALANHPKFLPTEVDKQGRGGFTKLEEDMYKFKTPSIYALSHSPVYGHGSSMHNLRSVIEYFNRGVKENKDVPDECIDSLFVPLNLTDDEIILLTDFVTNGLDDLDIDRHAPEHILSENCFPNNDELSKLETGCE